MKATDREIDAARQLLTAQIPATAQSPADIAAQRRADAQERAQLEADEAWAEIQAREDFEHEERGPLREALYAKLMDPAALLTNAEAAMKDLLLEQRDRYRMQREAMRAKRRQESASVSLSDNPHLPAQDSSRTPQMPPYGLHRAKQRASP